MYIADLRITDHGIRIIDLDKTSVHIPAYDALKPLMWLRKKESTLLELLRHESKQVELEEKGEQHHESATHDESPQEPTSDIP
jgi:hypothetical protein